MVVTEDGCRRAGLDEASKDVARVNLDAGKAAQPATLVEEDTMPHIERDGPELFGRQAGEACAHVEPDVRSTSETRADPRSLADRRPRKLERGANQARSLPGNGGTNEISLRSESQTEQSPHLLQYLHRARRVGSEDICH